MSSVRSQPGDFIVFDRVVKVIRSRSDTEARATPIRLSIDVAKVANFLAWRAARSSGGTAKALHGAVVVKIVNVTR